MHEAHFRFHHHVVACSLPIRACLPVAGDAGVYEARLDCADGVVVHAVFLEGIGEVILDEHIAVLDELVQDLDAGGLLERKA